MVAIVNGLVGGFVTTIVMSGFMMAMGDDSPPPTALLWAKYVGERRPDQYMMQGMILHFLYGTIGGGVFAWLVNVLDLSVAMLGGGLLWGIVWGLILFMIGAGFWMMTVLDISPDRQMAISFGVFHLVYGLVLGVWVVYVTL